MMSITEQDDGVMTILTAALQKPASERETYLRIACEGNDDLYREVADAVRWEERMGGFLLHPMVILQDPTRDFCAGQIVSERFEIARKIGEGGMGIVYEALDRKRHQRIALKFAKAGFQCLLSPELEGALKVRHPNICLVNEIHTARIEECEVDFLTMEFVEGETLSRYLSEHGKFPQEEALEIARQICAGLAEAHRSGIIHRDLKPGNVMLCPTAKEGLRVVIMDFGLAGCVALDSTEGGTPGYMAPELWKGKKASCESDIYSLGVILYQIVTGGMPVEEKSADPGKPSHFVAPTNLNKGLDPRWDRVILSCLDASPVLRPYDPRQVIAGLEKKPLRKAPFLTVASLIIATLAMPQAREWLSDRFWPPPNVRLAVLPLEGATNSADPGGGVLQDVSDRIRRMSSGSRTVVVIPPSEILDKHIHTADQAREVLHATHALQTRVKHEGDEFVAQGTIIDLSTQTPLREFAGRYSPATIGTMPAAFAGAISVALRLHGPVTPDILSSAATPAYDQGLYLLRRDHQSFDEAIASFEQAARLDPRSSLPLAGLVEAKIMKFEETHQQSCLDDARRSLRAAESLSPDSLRVRMAAGLLKETASQYEQALEDYRSVQDHEPRNVEALRRIAGVYDKLHMSSQAIEAYQNAIELDPGYYAGYHGLGVLYYFHGNYPEAARQFQKAIERAPGLFDEYTNLGAALDELGRDTEAEKALLTSLKLRETPRALNSMGAIRAYQKKDSEAIAYYKRAVALDPSSYIYVENLADSNRRLGRVRDADAAYRHAMELALATLKENPRLGYPRGYVAYIAARLGDRKRAEDEIAQALQLSPNETKVIRSAVLTYEALGERERAIQVLDAATPDLLQELDRQPDLVDFSRDSRFRQKVASSQNPNGGK
jgi:serine/threonine protein kinase/tetratricopeptide (TPR) repeat protein